MKAAIWTAYGPPEVLKLQDVDKPAPKDDEVLVKIEAANVFPGDCELRRFSVHNYLFWLPIRLYVGITRPRIKTLGQEFAGTVEAVGENVTEWKVGDRVFSPAPFTGGYAEYISLKPKCMALKPESLSFEEAATVCVGGMNALHFLRVAGVAAGQKVLINGAGGCIGTLAIQIAKTVGAEVTAVDTTSKLDKLRAIGADYVVDYTRENIAERGGIYDALIDIVGKSAYSDMLKSLVPHGCLVLGNALPSHMLRRLWSSITTDKTVRVALAGYKPDDLNYLKRLIEEEQIKPVVDRTYTLDQIVEAHRYVETGKRIGNVVLTVSGH